MPYSATAPKLPVLVYPGYHDAALTDSWMRSLPTYVQPHVIERIFDSLSEIEARLGPADKALPAVAVGFSAGVAGLGFGLRQWQLKGGMVQQIIAIDGLGVPLYDLPTCRLSSDRATHLSSLVFGAGDTNFYAEPAVPHLQLWENPQTVSGRQVSGGLLSSDPGQSTTAAIFTQQILNLCWQHIFNWREMPAGVAS